MTWNRELRTAPSVPSKVNHLPEVKKENWVVTSSLILPTEGFQAFPIPIFTDLSGILFIGVKRDKCALGTVETQSLEKNGPA